MSSRAIGEYILVDKVSEEIKTSSGLVLTGEEAAKIRYHKGEVVSPGTDVADIVSEGDVIYYDSSRSHRVNVRGVWYTVVRARDVVLIE